METSTLIYVYNMSLLNQTTVIEDDANEVLISHQESLNKIAPVLLVMIATLIGNLVLIVAIINKKSRRRKRVNVFIVNLAIADLTVAFITMTTELLEAMFRQWVLGALLCKLLLYFQVVTLSSTTFLLTGMSIDPIPNSSATVEIPTPKAKNKVKGCGGVDYGFCYINSSGVHICAN